MVEGSQVEPTAATVEPAPLAQQPSPTWADRSLALVEVGLCSDVPTQLVSGGALMALGHTPLGPTGQLRIDFVAPMLAIDSVLLIGLIVFFIRLRGERPGYLFFGERRWIDEVKLAVLSAAAALVIAAIVLSVVRTVAPWLHTVAQNPFEALVANPVDAAVFAVVGMIGGGVREEVQRAFVLRRFERYLGGRRIGIVVSSVAFGAGHLLQGADAALATGVLGAFWGTLYLSRGSIVAPVLSHAVFNTLQVGAFFVNGR